MFLLPSLKDSLPIFPQFSGGNQSSSTSESLDNGNFFLGDLSFGIPHSEVEDDEMDSQVIVGKSRQSRLGKVVVQNIPNLFLNLLFPPHTKPLVDEFPSMSGYFPRTPF